MVITLYNNTSEKEKIGKTLSVVDTLTGSIKQPSSIKNPIILIEYGDPTAFNYCHIDAFNRYYFVNDITIERNNLLRVSLTVDPLESFKTQILAQMVIVEKSYNNQELYMIDDNLKTLVKTKTDIVNFPSGLNDNGEFVLITAGG